MKKSPPRESHSGAFRRYLTLLFLIPLGYLFHVCVMPYVSVGGVTPNLLFAVIGVITVAYGRLQALWAGLVYGLLLEILERRGKIDEINVEVVAGVTAALAGAALLGAPLGHDLAFISLSDLLTPWELIEKRLLAAGEADFCIALYNPSSRGRKDHLRRAANLLLQVRNGDTPCGIADRIGREGESIRILTLRELPDAETDMQSVVLIGNSGTRRIGNYLVTERGYLKKYG